MHEFLYIEESVRVLYPSAACRRSDARGDRFWWASSVALFCFGCLVGAQLVPQHARFIIVCFGTFSSLTLFPYVALQLMMIVTNY